MLAHGSQCGIIASGMIGFCPATWRRSEAIYDP